MTSPGTVDKGGLDVGKGAAKAAEGSAEGVLLDLIARCEAAVGPDRELDAKIALLVGYRRKGARSTIGISAGYVWAEPGEHFSYGTQPPRYTASIDAALTLVPERWCWQVGPFNLSGRSTAQIAEPLEDVGGFGPGIGVRAQCEHSTAPLALVTAALKARLSALPAHKRRPTSPQETAE